MNFHFDGGAPCTTFLNTFCRIMDSTRKLADVRARPR